MRHPTCNTECQGRNHTLRTHPSGEGLIECQHQVNDGETKKSLSATRKENDEGCQKN